MEKYKSKLKSELAQAAKTALADPTQRATYEADFAKQNKIRSLFAYVVKQLYVNRVFDLSFVICHLRIEN